MIYAAFPGCGKTYFCQHNAGYMDLDIYALGSPIEAHIDTYKHLIRWCLEWGYKVIAIAEQCVIDALKEMELDFTLVLPSDGMKDEILKRIKNRSDNRNHYTYNLVRYDELIEKLKSIDGVNIIYLQPGQYLSDVIKEK